MMLQANFIDPYLPQDLSFNGCEWLIILNELSFFELKRDGWVFAHVHHT